MYIYTLTMHYDDGLAMAYEEEDTCMSYEEEDTCLGGGGTERRADV